MKQFDIEGFRNFLTGTIARLERELDDARRHRTPRAIERAKGALNSAQLIEHSLAIFEEEVPA